MSWDWLGTGLKIAGVVLDAAQGQGQARVSEAWATYNRTRDVKDMELFMRQQKAARDQAATRLEQLATDRAIIGMERQYLDAQGGYYTQMRQYALGASRFEADRLYRTRMGQIASQRASLDVKGGALRSERRLLAQKDIVLDVEARQRRATGEARMTAFDAGMDALAAQRMDLETSAAARRATMREEMQEGIGEAQVSQVARGFTGSYAQTEAARLTREHGRDVGVLEAQVQAQRAQLGVSEARLGVERQAIASEMALGAAREGMERVSIGERRRGVGLEERALGAERRLLGVQEGFVGTEADLIRTRGELEGISQGLAGARTHIEKGQVQQKEDRAQLEQMGLEARIESSDEMAAIAKWSLENLPDLPDYRGAAMGSAIGGLMALGAERLA